MRQTLLSAVLVVATASCAPSRVTPHPTPGEAYESGQMSISVAETLDPDTAYARIRAALQIDGIPISYEEPTNRLLVAGPIPVGIPLPGETTPPMLTIVVQAGPRLAGYATWATRRATNPPADMRDVDARARAIASRVFEAGHLHQ